MFAQGNDAAALGSPKQRRTGDQIAIGARRRHLAEGLCRRDCASCGADQEASTVHRCHARRHTEVNQQNRAGIPSAVSSNRHTATIQLRGSFPTAHMDDYEPLGHRSKETKSISIWLPLAVIFAMLAAALAVAGVLVLGFMAWHQVGCSACSPGCSSAYF